MPHAGGKQENDRSAAETNPIEENVTSQSLDDNIPENNVCRRDSISITSTITPREFFLPIEPSIVQRPGVEWIYPNDYDGPRNELGHATENSLDIDSEGTINESGENDSVDYIVDPNDVEVEITVEGRVVPKRLYFLKICGFVVCDDTFPFLLNSKLIAFVFVLFISGIASVVILMQREGSNSNLQHEMEPTVMNSSQFVDPNHNNGFELNQTINNKTSLVEPRVINITQAVLEVSGNLTLDKNSPQNKALNWILYEDNLQLAHNSSNLLQRYSMMVFYFSLSGENWFRKDGYGSGMHECEWYGVSCRNINGFKRISILKLVHNQLQGQIPNEVSLLHQLVTFELSSNKISGNIPKEVGQLRKLRRLLLDENSLTGTIPTEITNCENIAQIKLKSNKISGAIPEFSRKQKMLEKIDLEFNKLTGTIPSSIGSLISLQSLWLTSNHLTGTIPPDLANAYSIVELLFAKNELTGKIPTGIGSLSALKQIDISQNELSGEVPIELYHHVVIHELFLYDNFLTGTIPDLTDFLPRAQRIYLYNNMINGTIPEILGELPKLNALKLHFSKLSGTVPHSICARELQHLTVDCAGVNPAVFCSCCTLCY